MDDNKRGVLVLLSPSQLISKFKAHLAIQIQSSVSTINPLLFILPLYPSVLFFIFIFIIFCFALTFIFPSFFFFPLFVLDMKAWLVPHVLFFLKKKSKLLIYRYIYIDPKLSGQTLMMLIKFFSLGKYHHYLLVNNIIY